MTIICRVANQSFEVKKICKVCDMPKTAQHYWTVFLFNGNMQDIYRTDSGILYATQERN